MTPWLHAVSAAKKWGGEPDDYMFLENWFDDTKELTGNWTHRALRHSSHGIQEAVRLFGDTIIVGKLEKTRHVALRPVAEQHVIEDCGFIPTVQDWLKPLLEHPEPWMLRVGGIQTKPLEITP